MKLSEAIRIAKGWVVYDKAFEKEFNLEKIACGADIKERICVIETILQALEDSVSKQKLRTELSKLNQVIIYGTRTSGKCIKAWKRDGKIELLEKLLGD